MAIDPPAPPLRRNRFARHRKTTLLATVVLALAAIEGCAYLIILYKGHGDLRFQYRYNRILSGYTVFQNVPNHSFRTSAIKEEPSEPDPVLDQYGFLSDGPIKREKPSGTFRIFLIGGSTAFGAGQNVRYHAVHPYPDGLYSYPASIAGRLKAFLERANPGTRYEVINAAGFERRIHQSFFQYVQSLVDFHPDLMISLEGMNDVYSVVSGAPFGDVAEQLPFYVELYRRPHSLLNYSATYYVLSTAYEKWNNRRRSAKPAPPTSAGPPSSRAGNRAEEPGRAEYEKKKAHYEQNAERLLQVIRQYFAALQADGMRSLFVMQPLLHRKKLNKHLSDIERRLASVMVPTETTAAAPVDENALLLMYFYDDFLSPAIRKIAGQFGAEYIDMNAEIIGLGPDVEFYTDYCHLTPTGNKHMAEVLGRAILKTRPRAGL